MRSFRRGPKFLPLLKKGRPLFFSGKGGLSFAINLFLVCSEVLSKKPLVSDFLANFSDFGKHFLCKQCFTRLLLSA